MKTSKKCVYLLALLFLSIIPRTEGVVGPTLHGGCCLQELCKAKPVQRLSSAETMSERCWSIFTHIRASWRQSAFSRPAPSRKAWSCSAILLPPSGLVLGHPWRRRPTSFQTWGMFCPVQCRVWSAFAHFSPKQKLIQWVAGASQDLEIQLGHCPGSFVFILQVLSSAIDKHVVVPIA